MTSRPPRVGLVVDHPKRDLPGCLLLGHELARRGAETYLIPQYEQGSDVPLLGLDSLVVNYARPVNLDLVRQYDRLGIAVHVLDTEGGVLADDGPNTPDKLAAYVRTSGFADALAGYFFWGPLLRDAFLSGAGMPADRLHLTGCPRFDFAASSFSGVRGSGRAGHILINTNYPAVNPRFTTGRAADDRAALSSVGYGDLYIDRLLEDTRAIMNGMIKTARRLAADLPGQQFIIRPHPFENEAVYREAFAGIANIDVDGSGNVIDALSGARALLHLNCGTAIEAIMLGVIPYSLEFLNTEHMANHASLPGRASRRVESYEELTSLLGGTADSQSFDFPGRHAQFVEPYFHHNDGEAATRMADILVRGMDEFRVPSTLSVARSFGACRPSPRPSQIAQSVLANMIGSRASSRLRAAVQSSRRDKALDPEACASLLGSLAARDGGDLVRVSFARHPLTRSALATLRLSPSPAGVHPA